MLYGWQVRKLYRPVRQLYLIFSKQLHPSSHIISSFHMSFALKGWPTPVANTIMPPPQCLIVGTIPSARPLQVLREYIAALVAHKAARETKKKQQNLLLSQEKIWLCRKLLVADCIVIDFGPTFNRPMRLCQIGLVSRYSAR